MSNVLTYKEYFGNVEYSPEDNVFHGRVIGIKDHITYEGKDAESLNEDFRNSIEDYFEVCAEIGKEPEKICDIPFIHIERIYKYEQKG